MPTSEESQGGDSNRDALVALRGRVAALEARAERSERRDRLRLGLLHDLRRRFETLLAALEHAAGLDGDAPVEIAKRTGARGGPR